MLVYLYLLTAVTDILLLYCLHSEREATHLRRGVQSVEPHQLHGVLRWSHQRPHRGAHAENLLTFRQHPGDPSLQRQGLRLRQVSGEPLEMGHIILLSVLHRGSAPGIFRRKLIEVLYDQAVNCCAQTWCLSHVTRQIFAAQLGANPTSQGRFLCPTILRLSHYKADYFLLTFRNLAFYI